MTETNSQEKRFPCPSPTLEYDCAGCTDCHSEGTHAGCTKQHGHIGCALDTTYAQEIEEIVHSPKGTFKVYTPSATDIDVATNTQQKAHLARLLSKPYDPEAKSDFDKFCDENPIGEAVAPCCDCALTRKTEGCHCWCHRNEVTQGDLYNEFVRDVGMVRPMPKSLIRRRLDELLAKTVQEAVSDARADEASRCWEHEKKAHEEEYKWLVDTIAKCHTDNLDPRQIRFLLKERLLRLK